MSGLFATEDSPNLSSETLRYPHVSPKPIHTQPAHVTTLPAQLPPLTRLIRRLEAATSRLEDIANSATGSEHGGNGFEQANGLSGEGGEETQDDSKGEGEQSRDVAAAGATTAQGQAGKNEDVKLPESIIAMDALIAEQGKAFTEASKGLDPLVEEQVCELFYHLGCSGNLRTSKHH